MSVIIGPTPQDRVEFANEDSCFLSATALQALSGFIQDDADTE